VSEGIAISKAVAAKLTAASQAGQIGGFSFIAEHSLMPVTTLPAVQSLTVQVRPRGELRTFISRSKTQHDYPIEIIIRRHVNATDSLIAEELLTMAEAIADYWRFLAPGDALPNRSERLVGEVQVAFDDETIREQSVIKNTITTTFRGWRT
jgi:hypothetical protein